MFKRWAPGFTIVELLIVIVVIAILATLSVVGYNGVHKAAMTRAAQSDLDNVAGLMAHSYQKTGTYPQSLPDEFSSTSGITATVSRAGSRPFYTHLTDVQNGVLLSQICQDLINEGVGKGTNQGGTTVAFITGCGNWNHGSMQVTGWDSKVWSTPVTSDQLLNYGNTFTTSDTWNQDQARVVKTFYNELVSRLSDEGGSYPVTSFWDSWATPTNGGVMQQPLDSNPQTKAFYCIQAQSQEYSDVIWHVTESAKLESGSC